MKKQINNHSKMFNTIIAVLMSNQTIWNTIVAMVDAVTGLKTTVANIISIGLVQAQSTKGITLNKKQVRAGLTSKVMTLIGGLRAFAMATGNEQLLKDCRFTESQIKHMTTTRFTTTCQFIINLALTYKIELADYNITAAYITATVTDAATYISCIPQTREKITIIKNATQQLNQLVAAGMSQVKILDQFMLTFKESNPNFYAQYKDARKIIDAGIRHNKFTGKVVKGNFAVSGALIEVLNEDKTGVTAWNGEFEIEGVHTGPFSIKVKDGTDEKIINDLRMRRGTDLNYVIDLAA